MALAAAQVVDALAARLAAQTLAGGVATSRVHPWAEAELPACRIFAGDEEVNLSALGGDINQHTLRVECQYTTRAVSNLDDQMHALAAAGLPLLFAPPVPYALQLTGITRETVDAGEAAAVGRITLQLQATFFAAPAAPESIL